MRNYLNTIALCIWAKKQQANGATSLLFYRTWLITEGRLAGKRDNARIIVSTNG